MKKLATEDRSEPSRKKSVSDLQDIFYKINGRTCSFAIDASGA